MPVQVAGEPLELARLLWMMEQLMYDDLLRGTGWGRKRGWFRDSLDKCRTLAQVCPVHGVAGMLAFLAYDAFKHSTQRACICRK